MRRVFPWLFLIVGTVGLFLTWPGHNAEYSWRATSLDDAGSETCQSNLRAIGLAFAHYAQDFDGKFPRGVDTEDRAPETWSGGYGGRFAQDSKTVPLLPEVLSPYLEKREIWKCPSDIGWTKRRSNFPSQLGVVKPSSFVRFGTSYYYYTIHGFAGLRPQDIRDPSSDAVLFDGDLWHRSNWSDTLNALFADGHVENLPGKRFEDLGDRQNFVLPPSARM